ncbi:MAG: SRPBCC domain-containing protein [Armatimonadetes bacterium]|nr:SRPBCC domain-containing protein [Armatimonadota bacterium]
MKFALKPDHPVTDPACKQETGKTFKDWYAWIDKQWPDGPKRRDVTTHLWQKQKMNIWWATTIAVEYERHKKMKKKDGLYEGYSICSTKTFAAPMSRVYEAWTKLDQMNKWIGGEVSGEMKEGGTLTTGDKERFDVLRLRKNKDLRFDFHHPRFSAITRIDVMLEDKGNGKSGINVHHKRLQTRAEADSARNTWGEAMSRLKAMIE